LSKASCLNTLLYDKTHNLIYTGGYKIVKDKTFRGKIFSINLKTFDNPIEIT
jgi:hypothetical protein